MNSADRCLGLYVPHDGASGVRPPGAASKWWLHHSLASLAESLDRLGIPLTLHTGDPRQRLPEVARAVDAETVYCHRIHEPDERRLETEVAAALAATGRRFVALEGHLLRAPGEILNKSGEPYRVFTPYWRSWREAAPPPPLPAPPARDQRPTPPEGERLDDWGYLPRNPDWARQFGAEWPPGEAGARQTLERFCDQVLGTYGTARDLPGRIGTTRLSPHLHFGEISPRQVWHTLRHRAGADGDPPLDDDAWAVIRQLCWRDFNHDILARHPDMAQQNIDRRFDKFPWRTDDEALRAWQQGRTGYPVVDAGMRELWTTGWMHNRVRMICASFLIKHLMIDWREGEAWFWDTLIDADLANNAANWQWVAGSGMDAAPYFRIFNPVLQGERFDPQGDYVRKWVPERADLPAKHIHKPEAAADGLFASDYPPPIVDHGFARQRALAAFDVVKSGSSGG